MRPDTRGGILLASFMACTLVACAKKDDNTTAATTGDSTTVQTAAATPPSELLTQADKEVAAWNQEDANVTGAFFTDSVVAHIDTMKEMHGRTELVAKWIKPNLPMI